MTQKPIIVAGGGLGGLGGGGLGAGELGGGGGGGDALGTVNEDPGPVAISTLDAIVLPCLTVNSTAAPVATETDS